MIAVNGLTVIRAKKTILNDINLIAKDGALTVVTGPNGSGKTTLIAALAQDLTYSGEIHFNRRNINELEPVDKACMRGVLPQSSRLSFPFLVAEIVALGLNSGNAFPRKGEKYHFIEHALSRVGLKDYSGRFYQELSGGEQARVQLARVLCQIWHPIYNGEPCWLLLDEPVAALDIDQQLTVMEIARQFTRAGGGVIAILHDLNLTARYADHVILMKNGSIFASGPTLEMISSQKLSDLYDCQIEVNKLPPANVPFILPQTIAKTPIAH